jgi:hypothetical protein
LPALCIRNSAENFAPLILALSTVTGPIKEEMFVPPNFVSVPQEPIRRVVSYYTSINSNEVDYGKEVRKENIAIMTGNAQNDACGLSNPCRDLLSSSGRILGGGWRIVSSK